MGAEAMAVATSANEAGSTFLVVNPHSNGGATGRKWSTLEPVARSALGELAIAMTTRPLEATELTRQALLAGHRTVIAVGGDGTLNEVVNGFFNPDGSLVAPGAALALLPAGTGGDFRRTLQIPDGWDAAVRHVAAAPVRQVDVGRVRFRAHDGGEGARFFLNIASCGVSATVVHEVQRAPRFLGGTFAYKWGSIRALAGWRDRQVRIIVDGGAPEVVGVTALAVANGMYFGGGMKVAPGARVDDGAFACTLWSGYGVSEFLFRQGGVYSGAHTGWKKTRTFVARTVRAESDDDVFVEIDGEQPGMLPATFDVLPGALPLKG